MVARHAADRWCGARRRGARRSRLGPDGRGRVRACSRGLDEPARPVGLRRRLPRRPRALRHAYAPRGGRRPRHGSDASVLTADARHMRSWRDTCVPSVPEHRSNRRAPSSATATPCSTVGTTSQDPRSPRPMTGSTASQSRRQALHADNVVMRTTLQVHGTSIHALPGPTPLRTRTDFGTYYRCRRGNSPFLAAGSTARLRAMSWCGSG